MKPSPEQSPTNPRRAPAPTPLRSRHLVLIGGGHAHVAVLKSLGERPLDGVRTTLISDEPETPYSGMLPGLIAGHYQHAEAHIDLKQLAAFADATFIQAHVSRLDLEQREVLLPDGTAIPFDLLSINTGSTPATNDVPGALEHAVRVKPIAAFLATWNNIVDRFRRDPAPHRFVTVGGGAAGVELTLSAQFRLNRIVNQTGGAMPEFELVTADASLLPSHNPRVRAAIQRLCEQRGIEVRCNARVTRVDADSIAIDSGRTIPFDTLFWTTHAGAPEWPAEAGLKCSRAGFIEVNPRLASLSHDFVFAAGDVANLVSSPRPKSGVFAVREGDPLARNLRRALLGQTLHDIHLQRRFLSLISTGNQNAIASWAGLCASGSWVWKWKRHIDRKWMRQYQQLTPAHRK